MINLVILKMDDDVYFVYFRVCGIFYQEKKNIMLDDCVIVKSVFLVG